MWKYVLTLHKPSFVKPFSLPAASPYSVFHTLICITFSLYMLFCQGLPLVQNLKEVWNKITFISYSRLDPPWRPAWLVFSRSWSLCFSVISVFFLLFDNFLLEFLCFLMKTKETCSALEGSLSGMSHFVTKGNICCKKSLNFL